MLLFNQIKALNQIYIVHQYHESYYHLPVISKQELVLNVTL